MVDQEARRRFDWHDLGHKLVTAIVIAAVFSIGAFIWNNLSQGAVVRLLGGVAVSDIERSIKEILEREGFSAQFGVMKFVPASGAVIAFENGCPPGWSLAEEYVGSAIVGVGATIVGETGRPAKAPAKGNLYTYSDYPKPSGGLRDLSRGKTEFEYRNFAPDSYSEPISPFVAGVRTATTRPIFRHTFVRRISSVDRLQQS